VNTAISPDLVDAFRGAVGRALGLHLNTASAATVAEVLRRRAEANRLSCESYVRRCALAIDREETAALAQELTVGETSFYRNSDQFRALSEFVLPERLAARAGDKRLRLLSAGCASGEEAYSLAILLREAIPDRSWTASILALDANPAALAKAARARYGAWALRDLPEELRGRYFRVEGADHVLAEEVRTAVRFEERNLAEDDPGFWQCGEYDVIFCRNVLMYFTPENARGLVAHLALTIAEDGYLFLGHAETLRGLSQDFNLCHTNDTFYYRRKSAAALSAARTAPSWAAPIATPAMSDAPPDGAWPDAIEKASRRIAVLARGNRPDPWPAAATTDRATRPQDLSRAIDFLRTERYGEAIASLRLLPPESADDPAALLLLATVLAHSGALAAAAEAAQRLLGIDEFNAGAHYVLALCRDGSSDRNGALFHFRAAAYLDPGFAMPRLHLGLLARRSGDRAGARREFAQAIALLQREDDTRVLMFGGGFDRDALVALSRTEMLACEAAA